MGAALLRHVLEHARGAGLAALWLETGAEDFFAPARRLYARHGFVECGPFGRYRPDPLSVFMTRSPGVDGPDRVDHLAQTTTASPTRVHDTDPTIATVVHETVVAQASTRSAATAARWRAVAGTTSVAGVAAGITSVGPHRGQHELAPSPGIGVGPSDPVCRACRRIGAPTPDLSERG